MARLVTKFKYLKPGNRSGAGGYAMYIATREGVEKIDDTVKFAPATAKQRAMVQRIINDFPEAAQMIEYTDYERNKTIGNASEFISRAVEDNVPDLLHAKTYADYIATRPRAERFGSHGLFTDDGVQIQLNKVSEDLNAYKGKIWTVIVSLRREDAERLGFNTGARWRDMLRTQTQELSKQFHIPMENLKWFAAFHNEGHHPHVHIMVYSAKEDEGYLSPKGIETLRSSLANEIFSQDLLSIYKKQSEKRDELRRESADTIQKIISRIKDSDYDNPALEKMLRDLAEELNRITGKKTYGYLKADLKDLVDSIVKSISQIPEIAELYNLWYQQKEEVIRTYTDEIPARIPLFENMEFKTIRNAVIREAVRLDDSGEETLAEDCSNVANGKATERKGRADIEDGSTGETKKADAETDETDYDEKKSYASGDDTGPATYDANGENTFWEHRNPSNSDSHGVGSDNQTAADNIPSHTKNTSGMYAATGTVRLLYQITKIIENKIEECKKGKPIRTERKLWQKIEDKKQAQGIKMG